MKTTTIYATAKLTWINRKGCSQMRQGNAMIMAKRLETLRCPAMLRLLDGTVIGGCENRPHDFDDKRIKWFYWYDKEAIIKEVLVEGQPITEVHPFHNGCCYETETASIHAWPPAA